MNVAYRKSTVAPTTTCAMSGKKKSFSGSPAISNIITLNTMGEEPCVGVQAHSFLSFCFTIFGWFFHYHFLKYNCIELSLIETEAIGTYKACSAPSQLAMHEQDSRQGAFLC